jgi:hypothetical protein
MSARQLNKNLIIFTSPIAAAIITTLRAGSGDQILTDVSRRYDTRPALVDIRHASRISRRDFKESIAEVGFVMGMQFGFELAVVPTFAEKIDCAWIMLLRGLTS